MKNFIATAVVALAFAAPLTAFAAVWPVVPIIVPVIPVSVVTATADAGSSVTPSGSTSIFVGLTQTFDFGANRGFHLTNVSLDGTSQGTPSTLDVTGDGVDHSIVVTSASSGGGSLLFCSGPEAPGYTVGIVGGGCGGTTLYVPFNGTSCLFGQGCMLPSVK